MRFPSGDQTGALSRQVPSVSWRSRSPFTSMIHRFDEFWSFMMSTKPRAKTMAEPSGAICGLDTDSIWKKVSLSRTLPSAAQLPAAQEPISTIGSGSAGGSDS